jgi:hypothetical protein
MKSLIISKVQVCLLQVAGCAFRNNDCYKLTMRLRSSLTHREVMWNLPVRHPVILMHRGKNDFSYKRSMVAGNVNYPTFAV